MLALFFIQVKCRGTQNREILFLVAFFVSFSFVFLSLFALFHVFRYCRYREGIQPSQGMHDQLRRFVLAFHLLANFGLIVVDSILFLTWHCHCCVVLGGAGGIMWATWTLLRLYMNVHCTCNRNDEKLLLSSSRLVCFPIPFFYLCNQTSIFNIMGSCLEFLFSPWRE